MPRLQVYLPEDLYSEVKRRRLSPSELLQQAVRDEVRRRRLLGEARRYLAELVAEVGEPSGRELAEAAEVVRRVRRRRVKRAS